MRRRKRFLETSTMFFSREDGSTLSPPACPNKGAQAGEADEGFPLQKIKPPLPCFVNKIVGARILF